MARRLAERLDGMPGITLAQPVEANAVFVRAAPDRFATLEASQPGNVWNRACAELRWMCSFDTTDADIDGLIADLGGAGG